ncbi:hypothetical protein CC1G_05469 [Coprinopsis cinerea okayama7|uniref:Uncharacterized protein n=1 Tax=Coprinopsis cinerea (strain Okayama-7 / 130 / ATCC MYA-4618 / FGSC 9003) TaxID=240176 RepID=A8P5D6_COPC7|nr:hypothetical protein CC1G_05469 [Coprinopsis cinerea okayama7\|eukprot:XP_001838916.2 hypothetical protein CC1G_05469 [Coprinopsis cinerea okayama7\
MALALQRMALQRLVLILEPRSSNGYPRSSSSTIDSDFDVDKFASKLRSLCWDVSATKWVVKEMEIRGCAVPLVGTSGDGDGDGEATEKKQKEEEEERRSKCEGAMKRYLKGAIMALPRLTKVETHDVWPTRLITQALLEKASQFTSLTINASRIHLPYFLSNDPDSNESVLMRILSYKWDFPNLKHLKVKLPEPGSASSSGPMFSRRGSYYEVLHSQAAKMSYFVPWLANLVGQCAGEVECLELDVPNHEVHLGTLVGWGCGERLERVVLRSKGCSRLPEKGSGSSSSSGGSSVRSKLLKLEREFGRLREVELEDENENENGRGYGRTKKRKGRTPWEALEEAKMWVTLVRSTPVSEGLLAYLTAHPGALESLAFVHLASEHTEEEQDDGTDRLAQTFWSSVLPRFKKSLKKLVVETQYECGWCLRNAGVKCLAGFESLEHLEIPVHTEAGVLLDEEGGSVFIRTLLDLLASSNPSSPGPMSVLKLQFCQTRSYFYYVPTGQRKREAKAKEALEKGLERYSWRVESGNAVGQDFEPSLPCNVGVGACEFQLKSEVKEGSGDVWWSYTRVQVESDTDKPAYGPIPGSPGPDSDDDSVSEDSV